MLNRQKEEHGGVEIGPAFFGFLTAIGVGVLLTAIPSAAGADLGGLAGMHFHRRIDKTGLGA